MNIKSVFNPIIGDGKAQTVASRSIFGILLLATLVVMVITFLPRAAALPSSTGGSTAGDFLATNPEIRIAQRYAAMGRTSLAANPELGVAQRYAAVQERISSERLLAANPELILAGDHGNVTIKRGQPDFSANPELFVAQRFAADQSQDTVQASLADNPELIVAQRYMLSGETSKAGEFLATNPELSAVWRYASRRDGK